jgi:hypothetical protein
MIIGVVGMMDDFRPLNMDRICPCGNGKTCTISAWAYNKYLQEQRNIITNFHTRFLGAPWGSPSWSTYMTSQEIFDHWFDDNLEGSLICITELQSLLNSAARNAKLITYIEKCLQQRRKAGYDIIWDSQRLGSGDKRIRTMTDYIYRPEKWHCVFNTDANCYVPVERCPHDICTVERHQILVYQEIPQPPTIEELLKPRAILNSWEIGQLYDTKEKMKDTLHYNPEWG